MDKADGFKRRGGAHIFTTIDVLSKRFIDLSIEEVGKEGYSGVSLKQVSWKRIIEVLNTEFKGTLPYDLDQKALKNHWDSLKKKYTVWRTTAGLSGHGYNDSTGRLDWTESKWVEVIKNTLNAAQFKNTALKHANELFHLFEGVLAYGDESYVHVATGNLHPHLDTEKENGNVGGESETYDDYGEGSYSNQQSSGSVNLNEDSSNANYGTQSTVDTSDSSGKRKKAEPGKDGDAKLDDVVELVKEQFLFYKKQKEEKKAEREARKQWEMAELDSYSLQACLVYINSMKRSGVTQLKMEDYSVAMVKLAQSLEMRRTCMMLESLDEKAQFICGLARLG